MAKLDIENLLGSLVLLCHFVFDVSYLSLLVGQLWRGSRWSLGWFSKNLESQFLKFKELQYVALEFG